MNLNYIIRSQFLQLKLMNHKSPSPFRQFKFEDSLRKYEPPVKKKVKKNLQKCSQQLPISNHLTSKSRMQCKGETERRIGNEEKGVQMGRGEGRRRQIEKKEISQFMGEIVDYEEPETCNFWDRIQLVGEREEAKEDYGSFRQKVIDDLNSYKSRISEELMEENPFPEPNPFHNIELAISSIQTLRSQLLNELQILLSQQFFQQNCEEQLSQSAPISHQDHLYSQYSPSSQSQSQISQEEVQKGSEQVDKVGSYEKNILLNGARIRLEKKGVCRYVSTRILTKTVETQTVEEMKKRHPGLENVIEYLSELFQIGKSKTKTMMEFQ